MDTTDKMFEDHKGNKRELVESVVDDGITYNLWMSDEEREKWESIFAGNSQGFGDPEWLIPTGRIDPPPFVNFFPPPSDDIL